MFAEEAGEVVGVVQADAAGDFGDGEGGHIQQFAGGFEAAADEVSEGGFAGLAAEQIAQVVGGELPIGGEEGEVQIFVEAGIEDFAQLPDAVFGGGGSGGTEEAAQFQGEQTGEEVEALLAEELRW